MRKLALLLLLLPVSLPVSAAAQQAPPALPALAEPSLSPDGREIAFVSGGDIWTVPREGGEARILVSDPAMDSRPMYAPDGKRLAFLSTRSGNGDLYVVDLAGGTPKRITFDDGRDQLDGWSHDGQWLYFHTSSRDISGFHDLWRVRADGGTPMQVSAERYVSEYFAAPSPDGNQVAFTARGIVAGQWWRHGSSHIDQSQIWTLDLAGRRYQPVTRDGAREVWPMWSDGNISVADHDPAPVAPPRSLCQRVHSRLRLRERRARRTEQHRRGRGNDDDRVQQNGRGTISAGMKVLRSLAVLCLLLPSLTLAATQGEKAPVAASKGFHGEFLANLEGVQSKIVALAEATPAEKYEWRPAADVRSISEVYMHIVGGNYFLPTFTGYTAPANLDRDLEKNVTTKAAVMAELRRSFDHLRAAAAALSESELDKPVKMFGNQTTKRGVLVTALSHLHEHLGQSIAYARMNKIAPPWSATAP